MVRWEDQQDGIVSFVTLGERLQSCGSDGRCCIPGCRLHQNGSRCHADGPELLSDHESVLLVANYDGRLWIFEGHEPPGSGLQQGVLTQQRDELLGMVLSRKRPEPASGTAR